MPQSRPPFQTLVCFGSEVRMPPQQLTDLLVTLQKSQDHFRKHVVPIFEDNDRGQPEAFGTALVVAKAKRVFLVSAAHVLDPLAEDRNLFVYSDLKTKR